MLMNVLLVLLTAHQMLPVPTLLGTSPVPVTKDIEGMESRVWVNNHNYVIYVCTQVHIIIFMHADIDECADGSVTCSPDATCTNFPGGYSCTCRQGHSGDGTTCVGKRVIHVPRRKLM